MPESEASPIELEVTKIQVQEGPILTHVLAIVRCTSSETEYVHVIELPKNGHQVKIVT